MAISKKDTEVVSASSANQVGFNDQLARYDAAIQNKKDLAKKIRDLEAKGNEFVNKYEPYASTKSILEFNAGYIRVKAVPKKKTPREEQLSAFYNRYGSISQDWLVSLRPFVKSPKLEKFAEELTEYSNNRSTSEWDTVKTEKARKEFADMCAELREARGDLQAAEEGFKDVMEYINVVEKIAKINAVQHGDK